MEAMLPVEKKADCRRKRKNRAGRMSDRFRARYFGWLFEENEGKPEEVGVSVEASNWVGTPPTVLARGLDVGAWNGEFAWWVVQKLWI